MDFNDPANLHYDPQHEIGESLVLLSKEIEKQWQDESRKHTVGEGFPVTSERGKIPHIEYTGSVAHFRAWMERYLERHGKTFFMQLSAQMYVINYVEVAHTETTDVWRVSPVIQHAMGGEQIPDDRNGMILASETMTNKTMADFIDGAYYRPEYQGYQYRMAGGSANLPPAKSVRIESDPIGDDFFKLVEQIKAELRIEKPESISESLPLWERVPDIGWNREAIRLWHEGYTAAEIGRRVKKDEQTVRNKIADLRREHGEKLVPLRRSR